MNAGLYQFLCSIKRQVHTEQQKPGHEWCRVQPWKGLGICAFCSVNFRLDQKQIFKKRWQRTRQNLTRSNLAICSASAITSAAHQRHNSSWTAERSWVCWSAWVRAGEGDIVLEMGHSCWSPLSRLSADKVFARALRCVKPNAWARAAFEGTQTTRRLTDEWKWKYMSHWSELKPLSIVS